MRKFTSLPAVLMPLCSIVLAKTRKMTNRVNEENERLIAFATILIKETKSAVSLRTDALIFHHFPLHFNVFKN